MDIFILLINKTAARLASYTYKQVFVFYLINTLCSFESDELQHNGKYHYNKHLFQSMGRSTTHVMLTIPMTTSNAFFFLHKTISLYMCPRGEHANYYITEAVNI